MCLLALPLVLFLGQECNVQTPPPSAIPSGEWRSRSGGKFYIAPDGTCLQTTAQTGVAGQCEWRSNYKGGVLALYYNGSRVEYDVVWLDGNRFSIYKDEYYRVYPTAPIGGRAAVLK